MLEDFVFAVIFVSVLFFGSLLTLAVSIIRKGRQENAEQKAINDQKEEEERKRNEKTIFWRLSSEVSNTFHVWLGNVHEDHVLDEIVRQMSLLAEQTAEACVKQSKTSRGGIEVYNAGQVVYQLKTKWSKARELALLIAPELEERLPHFSEFEPLKSYNAEHLLQKKAKREAAQK